MNRCFAVLFHPGCGWCWYASTTLDQKHGGRPGNALGLPRRLRSAAQHTHRRPTDGGACSDWTWEGPDCKHHVDCPSLPDCLNILGTYCGWCLDSGVALKGTALGPLNGTCKHWIWSADYGTCPVQYGPQVGMRGCHICGTDRIHSKCTRRLGRRPTRLLWCGQAWRRARATWRSIRARTPPTTRSRSPPRSRTTTTASTRWVRRASAVACR